jgi:hypothetical protein
MLEETGDEFGGRDGAELDSVGAAVAVGEGDLAILEALQAAVGDGDAKEVAAEVGKDPIAAASVLAVNDPFLLPDYRWDLIE